MADSNLNVKFGAQTSGLVAGVAEVKEQVEGLRAPIDSLISSFDGIGEAIGAAFVIDKIEEFASSMAEMGERALNASFSLGLSVKAYAQLSGAMQLAGGNADTAQRTLEHLGLTVEQALQNPTGPAATAFKNLGISLGTVKANSGDLVSVLRLVIDAVADGTPKTLALANAHQLLGRGIDTLAGLMRNGGEGFRELLAAAEQYAETVARVTAREDESAEAQNKLALDLMALKHEGFDLLAPAIDLVVNSLDWLTNALSASIAAAEQWAADLRDIVHTVAYDIAQAIYQAFHGQNTALIPPKGFLPSNGDEAGQTIPIPAGRPVGAEKPGGQGRGGEGRGAGDDQDKQDREDERDLERELAQEANIRIAALNAEKEAADINFNSQLDHLRALVQQGKLTADQGLAQEQLVATQKWQADENYLQQKMQLYGEDEAGQQRVLDQELIQTAEFNAKMQEMADAAAKAVQNSWKEAAKQLSDAFASALTDVLTRTKSWAQAIDDLLRSLLKDTLQSTLKTAFSSILGGGEGAGGSGGGLDLTSLLFGQGGLGGLLFGKSGLSGALGLGEGGLLGSLGSLFGGGGSADQDFSGGIGEGATGAVGGLLSGGLFGTLFKGLGSLFAFSQGGIVPSFLPSAAGGWTVPMLGPSGTLAQLHSNEMVLPANISQGLQGMIAGGGGAPNVSANFNVQAFDSQSTATFFRNNGAALVDALNRAMRNGSQLRGVSY